MTSKATVKSVEPNIADLVNGWLKSYKVDYKLEQESLNTEIDQALNDYFSKNGGKGGNRPDAKLLLLAAERKKIGIMHPGQAANTPAFNLDAKYIIHTVGPAWIDGNHDEREILHSCYEKSLNLAAELSCRSIAFPLIATGSYGFPKDEALQIALAEIDKFLQSHEMEVILVVLGRRAFELSEKLVGDIEEYIDEHGIAQLHEAEYGIWYGSERWGRPEQNKSSVMLGAPLFPDVSGMSLDEILESSEDTFQQRLFKLIEESGMDDVTVYKKANIDRKVFSRIRCKEDYKPTKKTAVAFAIALQLDMPAMLDLLSRAGIAFSPSSKFDLIITYFVTNKVYDIYEINAALFKYGQPILGA